MRLYSIFLYILILNAVFGFVVVSIDNGLFIEDAKGAIHLPNSDIITDWLDEIDKTTEEISKADGFAVFGLNVLRIAQCFGLVFSYFFSIFTVAPQMMADFFHFPIPAELITIISIGMMLITVFTAFQIISGKNFQFIK